MTGGIVTQLIIIRPTHPIQAAVAMMAIMVIMIIAEVIPAVGETPAGVVMLEEEAVVTNSRRFVQLAGSVNED